MSSGSFRAVNTRIKCDSTLGQRIAFADAFIALLDELIKGGLEIHDFVREIPDLLHWNHHELRNAWNFFVGRNCCCKLRLYEMCPCWLKLGKEFRSRIDFTATPAQPAAGDDGRGGIVDESSSVTVMFQEADADSALFGYSSCLYRSLLFTFSTSALRFVPFGPTTDTAFRVLEDLEVEKVRGMMNALKNWQ
ncbi:hypothetical protein B0H19DRAFT_1276767 [Mycena capillaripes]|nr:hypothetical protein B0H19DRAFT_1276767 [Mycena capillaripes]